MAIMPKVGKKSAISVSGDTFPNWDAPVLNTACPWGGATDSDDASMPARKETEV